MNEELKRLLELAAKAAGHRVLGCYDGGLKISHKIGTCIWLPHADDGDALRLAVKLRITVEQCLLEAKCAAYVVVGNRRDHYVSVSGKVTRGEATRLAIVRAAAAIGEAMP